MLRSILAQLEFTYLIRKYAYGERIPFRSHLHVPEVHPLTGSIFYGENEAHVLKVCNNYTLVQKYTLIIFTAGSSSLH